MEPERNAESSVAPRIPLADARGSETLILSRDREGAVVRNHRGQESSPTTKSVKYRLSVVGLTAAHIFPLALFFTGTRRVDWIVLGTLYFVISFALGAGLHRYFAHRAFRTSRGFQFAMALVAACFFGDALGFAAKHRQHHRTSDTDADLHSPRRGFWRCWIGHMLDDCPGEEEILRAAPDLAALPEMHWLHRFVYIPALTTAVLFLAMGGYRMFACSYCLAFLFAVHGPSAVNYFCHRGGYAPYRTGDRSCNQPVLAVLLLGEGWHNNHHYFPGAARSGFLWYEVDVLYAMLRMLSWTGLVWDLRQVPETVMRTREGHARLVIE